MGVIKRDNKCKGKENDGKWWKVEGWEEIGTRIAKLRYMFMQNCGMEFLSAETKWEKKLTIVCKHRKKQLGKKSNSRWFEREREENNKHEM